MTGPFDAVRALASLALLVAVLSSSRSVNSQVFRTRDAIIIEGESWCPAVIKICMGCFHQSLLLWTWSHGLEVGNIFVSSEIERNGMEQNKKMYSRRRRNSWYSLNVNFRQKRLVPVRRFSWPQSIVEWTIVFYERRKSRLLHVGPLLLPDADIAAIASSGNVGHSQQWHLSLRQGRRLSGRRRFCIQFNAKSLTIEKRTTFNVLLPLH